VDYPKTGLDAKIFNEMISMAEPSHLEKFQHHRAVPGASKSGFAMRVDRGTSTTTAPPTRVVAALVDTAMAAPASP
jgi:hypothetical protein